jgi:peptide/nickel transport system permease protein
LARRLNPVLRLVLRRLAAAVPLLLGVIIINFCLIQAAPGSLMDVMTSESQITDPAMLAHLREIYGVNDPAWMQLLKYIWSVLHLDFGFSYRQNQTVISAISERLPATLLLMASGLSIAAIVGVCAGIFAALCVGTIWDSLITGIALLCFAAPSFWLGLMLIILFAVQLEWLPVGGMQTIGGPDGIFGMTIDIARHLVLPALSLGLFYAAIYTRVMRASMLEVARMDFVRTARAKGLGRVRIVLAHMARNALLPVVTILGLQMGTMLAGSITIETVFGWPGIGLLLLDSVMARNYPVVLGVLVMSACVVIVANILVDLAYMRLDPRIALR